MDYRLKDNHLRERFVLSLPGFVIQIQTSHLLKADSVRWQKLINIEHKVSITTFCIDQVFKKT